MRRIALSLALIAALLAPASVAAAPAAGSGSGRCSVEISPEAGAPTDIYRITVTNVPVAPDGNWIEVRLIIKQLGTRGGSVYFATLVPGTTVFYVDHNQAPPEEPPTEIATGRYLVDVSTPHIHGAGGCHTMGQFVVS